MRTVHEAVIKKATAVPVVCCVMQRSTTKCEPEQIGIIVPSYDQKLNAAVNGGGTMLDFFSCDE